MKHVAAPPLSRLIRYVEPGVIPGAGQVVSVYDASQNFIVIDRGLFSLLSEQERRTVLRTHKASLNVVTTELGTRLAN